MPPFPWRGSCSAAGTVQDPEYMGHTWFLMANGESVVSAKLGKVLDIEKFAFSGLSRYGPHYPLRSLCIAADATVIVQSSYALSSVLLCWASYIALYSTAEQTNQLVAHVIRVEHLSIVLMQATTQGVLSSWR